MISPLIFIFTTLFELYILCFLLRFVLQAARADFHNPLSQFIVRVTNPLVLPLRRVIPGFRGLDMSSVVVVLALEILVTTLLFLIPPSQEPIPTALGLLYIGLLRTIRTVLRMYLFAVLIYALMSFVNPGTYNPLTSVLASISEPLLRPVRKVIPPIGGLDLSPLFVIIGLQALIMAVPLHGLP